MLKPLVAQLPFRHALVVSGSAHVGASLAFQFPLGRTQQRRLSYQLLTVREMIMVLLQSSTVPSVDSVTVGALGRLV